MVMVISAIGSKVNLWWMISAINNFYSVVSIEMAEKATSKGL